MCVRSPTRKLITNPLNTNSWTVFAILDYAAPPISKNSEVYQLVAELALKKRLFFFHNYALKSLQMSHFNSANNVNEKSKYIYRQVKFSCLNAQSSPNNYIMNKVKICIVFSLWRSIGGEAQAFFGSSSFLSSFHKRMEFRRDVL